VIDVKGRTFWNVLEQNGGREEGGGDRKTGR
jgi:hypothetical protein